MRRLVAFGCVALWLVSCVTPTPEPRDSAPSNPPADLARLPDAVPRTELPSKYGNKSPYQVNGKTYYLLKDVARYREYGRASWYGVKFHGRPTSSGERYDMYQLTAAHRSLPIPSYVRVTNLDNHKSAIVRVNDRGPFHDERLIDLSYAAAVKLGFADRGTARVMVELVDGTDQLQVASAGAPPQPPNVTANVVPVSSSTRLFLQAGAFTNPSGAERLRQRLTELIGSGVHIHRTARDRFYRVRIGPIEQLSEATRLQGVIVGASFAKPLIVWE
jgi:peptidoglycan lytic transglycosylase